MTSDASPLGLLRRAALIVVLAGAAGSVGLLLSAPQRPSLLLRVIMALWVFAPFGGLVLVEVASRRWSDLTRAMLYSLMLAITLGSLAAYINDALGPRKAQAAFVFVVTPLVSWLLLAIAVPIAALISRRRPR